jgi:ribonuclease HII
MQIPTLDREHVLWSEGCQCVAGMDEVGRGPLAGPVVAAAVVFRPGHPLVDGVRDSKTLTTKQRERLIDVIRNEALTWGVGAASVREIDRRNILRATALAMRRAVARLAIPPDRILIDGSPLPELRVQHEAIVGGDATCQSIAAASVLAKWTRDRLMLRLAVRYPNFLWDRNKGYATEEHLAAIETHGFTPHHRLSFAPFAQLRLL